MFFLLMLQRTGLNLDIILKIYEDSTALNSGNPIVMY
jgi:hypothetical protein